jgi:CheY-like chemotaxis protein
MGGELWVESEVGKGSRFHFTLKLARCRDQQEQANARAGVIEIDEPVSGQRPAEKKPPQNKSAKRLLLAEDNPDNQKITIHFLTKGGYQVELVDNGRAAVEAAATGKYDLILMDIYMPEMDGFEATKAIRIMEKQHGREPVPIIAFTAHAVDGYRDKCIEHEMNDYIAKPVRKKELLQVLAKWCAPHSQTILVDDKTGVKTGSQS